MTIKFYGTRGSIPIPNGDFLRFGGNTSCVTVKMGEELYIIDAGTGIRRLGKELIADATGNRNINILFTHFHLDHIQGLPFFDPAYCSDFHITLITKKTKLPTLKKVISDSMNQNIFPVSFRDLKAHFHFKEIEQTPFEAISLNHPGGCLGFRFRSETGKTIVYMVDHELVAPLSHDYVQFCHEADVLIHDGQFTREEYEKYTGWGHSSIESVIELAKKAQVNKLILTHHDPDHDDARLQSLQEVYTQSFESVLLAQEGLEITI